jgi:hypothetical protein
MAQQFLHRADVGARLQQVCGERVAQRVNRYMLHFRQPGLGALPLSPA